MPSIVARISNNASNTARGIGCMCVAAFGSSAMNGLIREASFDVHPFEIAFFRNLFGLMALTPILIRNGILRTLKTSRLRLHAIRGLFNSVAMLLFFYALISTPLAEVAALAFTAPLFATVLAILVLGERVGMQRWAGIVVGFLGALVVLQPGVDTVQFGAILVLASSAIWACAMICIKKLGSTESSLTTTTYAALFLIPVTFFCSLFVWSWPQPTTLLMMVGVGILGSLTQISIAQAFRDADVSIVVPFDFTKLIWASIIGYWYFDEFPKALTIVGGAIIITSVSFIAYRESRVARVRH